MEKQEVKDNKVLKVLNIVFNVFFYTFIVVVLLFAISTLTKKTVKDIPNLFGKGYLVVLSDSMEGDKKENFFEGELIVVDILSDDEKDDLEVGEIISFYDVKLKRINTHRIIDRCYDNENNFIGYETQGDNTPGPDEIIVSLDNVVAKYNGFHSMGWGKLIGFITDAENPLGFILCIVLPAVLFLIYTVVMFIKSLMAINVSKAESEKESIIAEYEAKKLEEERRNAETAARLKEMEEKLAALTAEKENKKKNDEE